MRDARKLQLISYLTNESIILEYWTYDWIEVMDNGIKIPQWKHKFYRTVPNPIKMWMYL